MKIPDPVVVRIKKRLHIELIDDGIFVPNGIARADGVAESSDLASFMAHHIAGGSVVFKIGDRQSVVDFQRQTQ